MCQGVIHTVCSGIHGLLYWALVEDGYSKESGLFMLSLGIVIHTNLL